MLRQARMFMLGRFIRAAFGFLLNLFVAAAVTNALVNGFVRATGNPGPSQLFLREEIFNAAASFGLGYFVYRRWHPDSSKWIWLAGLCWFALGAFRVWLAQRATASVLCQGPTIYSDLFGSNCRFDIESCRDWSLYTLQLLKTAFYSAGAFCCSRMRGWILAYENRLRR
jgi:hypothetical protein